MKKVLTYGVKFNGQPHIVTREDFKHILKGTCIIRRHYSAIDKMRTFGTANGNVLYMQYMTLKQQSNHPILVIS